MGFAAGEGGCSLAQSHVGEAHIHKRLQLARNCGDGFKENQSIFHGHFQHLMDILALVPYLQRFPVVALALADVAGHIDVRQEMHFYLGHAVTLAGLAASALDVEAKSARFVTAGSSFLCARKKLPNRSENARIGGGVRARRAADGALVYIDTLVDMAHASDGLVGGRGEHGGTVEFRGGNRVQGAVD